jgi:hypothetical protein
MSGGDIFADGVFVGVDLGSVLQGAFVGIGGVASAAIQLQKQAEIRQQVIQSSAKQNAQEALPQKENRLAQDGAGSDDPNKNPWWKRMWDSIIGDAQAAGDNDTGSRGTRPGGRLYGKNIPEAKPQGQRPFEIHPRVEGQLKDPSHMGNLAGKLTPKDIQNLSVNPGADRYFDVRTGNINVINNVDGATLRITVPRDTMRIISVGRERPNHIQNIMQRGDWVPLP